MLTCKFCNKECKSLPSIRNHERLCKKNPDLDDAYMYRIREAALRKTKCQHCDNMFSTGTIRKHESICLSRNRVCLHCKKEFRASYQKQEYCSAKCCNTALAHKPRKDNRYTAICFRHHERKCVVCGFDKIVAVHHYDENHDNNDSANLIPLCPNHHTMIHHSVYVNEIKPVVDKYLEVFRNKYTVLVNTDK